MEKTYTINNYDNHLIIEDNGKTLLIDTGSPFSIFDGASLDFCGRQFPKGLSMCSADAISSLLGMHVDALVGNDILKHFNVLVDYAEGTITLSDEALNLPDAVELPFDLSFGVPKVNMTLQGEERRFFLDTGAKISYVSSQMTQGLNSVETATDFYMGFGNFDTPIYNMEASVAGQSFNVRVGNLPPILEGTLIGLSGTAGVIGYDFFNRFKVVFDYANCKMLLS